MKQPPTKSLVVNSQPKPDPSREQLRKKIFESLEPDNTIDPSLVKVQSSNLAEMLEHEVFMFNY